MTTKELLENLWTALWNDQQDAEKVLDDALNDSYQEGYDACDALHKGLAQ